MQYMCFRSKKRDPWLIKSTKKSHIFYSIIERFPEKRNSANFHFRTILLHNIFEENC